MIDTVEIPSCDLSPADVDGNSANSLESLLIMTDDSFEIERKANQKVANRLNNGK